MHFIITSLTATSLALLLVILSVITIRARMKHNAAFGDAGEQRLTSAIRAHGNLTEYAPMGLILIALLEANDASHGPLLLVAAAFVVARVLNAIGLFNPPGPPPLTRSIGIVSTLAILLGLAVWLFVLIHMPLLK